MRLINTAERSSPVYITDLKVKVSATGLDVPITAVHSQNLKTAIEQGSLAVKFTDEELLNETAQELRDTIDRMVARAEGAVLAAGLVDDIHKSRRGRLFDPSSPYVKPAYLRERHPV